MKKKKVLTGILSLVTVWAFGQQFEQLGTTLPTPNSYRTASGAPGHEYWQQKADHKIKVTLDDQAMKLYGEEKITYYNHSPDELSYLWLQVDQNIRSDRADAYATHTSVLQDSVNFKDYYTLSHGAGYKGGYQIEWIRTEEDADLTYTVNKTMMRV